MKAIKKTRENLIKVARSICDVPFVTGLFFFDDEYYKHTGCVRLTSNRRNSINSVILNVIPSNFFYHICFEDDCLILTIWYE